jgi:hypothetical protein
MQRDVAVLSSVETFLVFLVLYVAVGFVIL